MVLKANVLALSTRLFVYIVELQSCLCESDSNKHVK